LASLLQQLVEAGIVPEGASRVIIDIPIDEPVRVYFEADDALLAEIDWREEGADGADAQPVDDASAHYDRLASSLPF